MKENENNNLFENNKSEKYEINTIKENNNELQNEPKTYFKRITNIDL